MNDITKRILVEIDKASTAQAEACMVRPKKEPFDHGEQIGRWQGLQAVRDLIIALVEEDQKQDV